MQNMKRIFHIIAAGVALFTAFSCVKEETKVIYDLSNATAPVLGSWELTKDGVTAAFTPATFGFNDKMVAHFYHYGPGICGERRENQCG